MQKKYSIPFAKSGLFSKLFIDYVNEANSIRSFYTYSPNITSFEKAIADKKKENINRSVLVKVLESQYAKFETTAVVKENIQRLNNTETFTVCTGHQLCLFTGPLYFIYKIVSTINLAEALNKKYPTNYFVPVYWMASEDHDFEEIKSIHAFGKKVAWENTEAKGAVGRLQTASLNNTLQEFKQVLGTSEKAEELFNLFADAYLGHSNLADATQYLVNRLFSEYGLVVLNPDDAQLKAAFSTVLLDDIFNSTNYKLVNQSIEKLKAAGYEAQVNPREINVFKLEHGDRVRIEKAEDSLKTESPYNLSPNVVLRPLYQQTVLPNLAYVGGPGEIAYWLEYKAMFDHHGIAFPVLIPRNFALITDEKTEQQINKLGFENVDFFNALDVLNKAFVTKNASVELSLLEEEEQLRKVYAHIATKAGNIDTTLKASVEGELQKALNAIKNIEGKLMRSEKQKQETSINQIKKIKEKFFPDNTLQERYDNMAPYYLKTGKNWITDLKNTFDPFNFELLVLEQ